MFGVWLLTALEVDFAKIEIDIFFFEWRLDRKCYGHGEGWEGIAGGDDRSDVIRNGEMPVDFDETGYEALGWGNGVFAIFED